MPELQTSQLEFCIPGLTIFSFLPLCNARHAPSGFGSQWIWLQEGRVDAERVALKASLMLGRETLRMTGFHSFPADVDSP